MSHSIRLAINKISSNLHLQLQQTYRNFSTTTSLKNRNSSTKAENNLSQYITVKVSKDDYIPVLKLMHNAFYPYEPTCAGLGIGPNRVMDERVIKDMAEGMSLMVRHKHDGDIVGACINYSIHPWDPQQTEKLAKSCKCSNLRYLLQFFAHVTRSPNLFKSYGVSKVFEIGYLFIAPEHRRKGLSYRLMEESKNLAREKDFQIIRCDATNFITANICEKLGMKLVDEIQYSTYFGKKVEPVLNPPPPHNSVKIYIDENLETVKKPIDIDPGAGKDLTTPTK